MSESERHPFEAQMFEAQMKELQARLVSAEANIDALVLAVERLNQSVRNLEVSKTETFDSMFIRKQLDAIRQRQSPP